MAVSRDSSLLRKWLWSSVEEMKRLGYKRSPCHFSRGLMKSKTYALDRTQAKQTHGHWSLTCTKCQYELCHYDAKSTLAEYFLRVPLFIIYHLIYPWGRAHHSSSFCPNTEGDQPLPQCMMSITRCPSISSAYWSRNSSMPERPEN